MPLEGVEDDLGAAGLSTAADDRFIISTFGDLWDVAEADEDQRAMPTKSSHIELLPSPLLLPG